MALVEKLFPSAREHLVTLQRAAHVTEAAALLSDRRRHLVVVCDPVGAMVGVVARRDIVREVSHCLGCACTMACGAIMTSDIVACHPSDALELVWRMMADKGLRNIPIVDEARRPLGVATARETAALMLREAEYDQATIMEYVMSIGYR